MPWNQPIRSDRELRVDLRPGVQGEEWERLMDAILLELPNVDRVVFLVPGLTAVQEETLDTLVHVLTKRGVHVERRHVS
jgi:hypothetical protein